MSQPKTIITQQLSENKLFIQRAFKAPLATVWKAWTTPEILDQWWAPKPWKASTKKMDFRNGGTWLYSMNGPEGEQHWARADFHEINPMQSYRGDDSFCDENGVINEEIPGMHWQVSFSPKGDETMVEVQVTFDKAEDLQKIVEMGFQEGFTMAHGNLDELLPALS